MVGTGYSVMNTGERGTITEQKKQHAFPASRHKKGLRPGEILLHSLYPSPLSLVACVNLQ